jgi:hypothetical protein
MLKKLALLLIAALLSLSCNTISRLGAPAAATPVPNASEAEYAVYKALIESTYATDKLAMIVIHDTTSAGMDLVGNNAQEFEYIQKALPEVDASIKDSFVARNAQPAPLEDRFNLVLPVTLLNQDDFNRFFSKNGKGWDAFYLEYPQSQGVLTLSKVGFNAKGDKALVYAGNQAYSLAGAGYAVVLGFENGAWKVLNQVMLWIS